MFHTPTHLPTTACDTPAALGPEVKSTTTLPVRATTTSHMNRFLSTLLLCVLTALSIAQNTYSVGNTEYYYDRTYSTTGLPMVKRSEANRAAFLRSQGYNSVPYGYEVDHIVPLSQGGSDDPSNMQLLTVEEHDRKTARERARTTNTTYRSTPAYRSSYTPAPQYSAPSNYYAPSRTIHTGPRGGQYYINSNGNKTYIRKK